MLLSPGHSPRHLLTPSPSPNPNPNATDINYHSDSELSPALRKRRRSTAAVLDEDSYVEAIEKIIERDFFPDIPKLRDRYDWLHAVNSGDPVRIREAQLSILHRRRQNSGDATASRRGGSKTPGSTFFRNTSVTPSLFNNPDIAPEFAENNDLDDNSNGELGEKVDTSLGLDEFFRRYTSEDNESFSKLIEKTNRKKKERYSFLLEVENDNSRAGLIEGGDSSDNSNKRERIMTDGYGTSDQPVSTLDGWKYRAKNLLMYHPADQGEAPLTDKELAVRLKGLTKEITRSNTRFHSKMVDVDGSLKVPDEDSIAALYTPLAGATPIVMNNRDRDSKYDLDDLRKTPNKFYVESDKKAENGYRFVKTPSPAPGVDESPFITWGEIEGTPLRLEMEDTPIDIGGSGNGPQFKIPNPPSRDEKAHSLAREAARKVRERSRMFEKQKPPLPSPMRGGSASPGRRMFSPAAEKLMRNAMAKSSKSIDESLRASYRSASPGSVTPKVGRSVSRLGRDGTKSPSVREGSTNPPW